MQKKFYIKLIYRRQKCQPLHHTCILFGGKHWTRTSNRAVAAPCLIQFGQPTIFNTNIKPQHLLAPGLITSYPREAYLVGQTVQKILLSDFRAYFGSDRLLRTCPQDTTSLGNSFSRGLMFILNQKINGECIFITFNFYLVRPGGIEPPTPALKVLCSTPELRAHIRSDIAIALFLVGGVAVMSRQLSGKIQPPNGTDEWIRTTDDPRIRRAF